MKRVVGTIAAVSLLFFATPAKAGHEPVGVAFGLISKGGKNNVQKEIEVQIQRSKRFVISREVSASGLYPWSEAQWKLWRKQTDARFAIVGTVTKPDGKNNDENAPLELNCRILDLKQGSETKQLTYSGTKPQEISEDLVRLLRTLCPLTAVVTPVKDDLVLLDVGNQDGVTEGMIFIIWRYPEVYREKIAALKISKTDAWYSEAKIVDPPLKSDMKSSYDHGKLVKSQTRTELKFSGGNLSIKAKNDPISLGNVAIEDIAAILMKP